VTWTEGTAAPRSLDQPHVRQYRVSQDVPERPRRTDAIPRTPGEPTIVRAVVSRPNRSDLGNDVTKTTSITILGSRSETALHSADRRCIGRSPVDRGTTATA